MGNVISMHRSNDGALQSSINEARRAIQAIAVLQQCSSSLFSTELPEYILNRLETDMKIILNILEYLRGETYD